MSEPDDAYDDDALAAEYVLHLLDDEERRAFEVRLLEDNALRQLVRDWEGQFAMLAGGFSEVTPPPAVRKRILQTVEDRTTTRKLTPFRAWLLGGAVAVTAVVFILGGDLLGPKADLRPAFEAELASDDRSFVVTAGVIPATHEIVVERVAGVPPVGRVHELWLIAVGSDVPISLGLLQNEGVTRIRVPDDIAPGVRTGTVAISEEPLGGSPTGAPTGPIVATAQFSDL